MGRKSRDKGARGEREFAAFLQEHGHHATRGRQFRGGPNSPDVLCDDLPIHFEIKRAERLRLYDALSQAAAETSAGKMPIVAHRPNGRDWICVLSAVDLLKLIEAPG